MPMTGMVAKRRLMAYPSMSSERSGSYFFSTFQRKATGEISKPEILER